MKRFVLLGAVLILLLMAGCGGGSGGGALIGSLTMDAKLVDETGGWYHAEVTSVYKHPTKDSTGVELTFTMEARTRSGVLKYSSAITKKQTSGGITVTWPSIQQDLEAITLDLTVSTGDLIKYQRLTIPAATPTPLTATPSFVNMSTGLLQKVLISGSFKPYSVVSRPAGVTTTISASELTISEAAFQKLNGIVVVQGFLGDQVVIDLRY